MENARGERLVLLKCHAISCNCVEQSSYEANPPLTFNRGHFASLPPYSLDGTVLFWSCDVLTDNPTRVERSKPPGQKDQNGQEVWQDDGIGQEGLKRLKRIPINRQRLKRIDRNATRAPIVSAHGEEIK